MQTSLLKVMLAVLAILVLCLDVKSSAEAALPSILARQNKLDWELLKRNGPVEDREQYGAPKSAKLQKERRHYDDYEEEEEEDEDKCESEKETHYYGPKLPSGFFLAFEPKFGFNLYDNEEMGSMAVQLKTEFKYRPPEILLATGRSLQSPQEHLLLDKRVLYNTFSQTIKKFGLDGEVCLRRAVCEIAVNPLRSDGMLGHMINLALTPSVGLEGAEVGDQNSQVQSLLEAEYVGRSRGQCYLAYSQCPVSLFTMVERAAGLTNGVLSAVQHS